MIEQDDLTRDLAPVSLVVTMTNVLVVHPSLPARSVKELLTLAKARPGTLNSASAGVGNANHLALVLLNTMVESLRAPKVREILASSGAEAAGGAPEELARFLRDEIVKWGKVVKAAGINPE